MAVIWLAGQNVYLVRRTSIDSTSPWLYGEGTDTDIQAEGPSVTHCGARVAGVGVAVLRGGETVATGVVEPMCGGGVPVHTPDLFT